MSRGKLLLYLLRRDLRVSDNPILHYLATTPDHGFTHFLPVYVFPAHQVEVSGFLKDGETSPYPPARSHVGKYWRCGPHRAKFTAETVWNLKENLEELGSGLSIRVGSLKDVLEQMISELKNTVPSVSEVWMTEEPSWEEIEEQESVSKLCSELDIDFKLWKDEKYFIDDRDTGLVHPKDLPDVFTTYRKSQEPLREKPRKVLPRPGTSVLPTFPKHMPAQAHPFKSAESLSDLVEKLVKPLNNILSTPPNLPSAAQNGHPFAGGESAAWERLKHLGRSGAMTSYKETRNGLLGQDYSTKLSGYLSLGCLTARQVHEELLKLEDATDEEYKSAPGYGQGENEGTKGVRFELLWRDYMRLCTAKFGRKLFRLSGFREDATYGKKWNAPEETTTSREENDSPASRIAAMLERFQSGSTGMGLIDASQRELFHTGYTSNRARQNVASFFSKHMEIDWRYGAEWYEMLLIDYDVSSNWANWQYVAGVGNDPRGDARTFNPVKQSFDYDKDGSYVRMWLPELGGLENLENVFQPWTSDEETLNTCGLSDNIMVKDPIIKIKFYVDRKPRPVRKPYTKRRGQPRGGRWGYTNNHRHNGNGSGTSSEATAGDFTAANGWKGNRTRLDLHPTQSQNGSTSEEGQLGSQGTPHTSQPVVCDGRSWHGGGNHVRGRGNGYVNGQNRGNWRGYGTRGGSRGRYPGSPTAQVFVAENQQSSQAEQVQTTDESRTNTVVS